MADKKRDDTPFDWNDADAVNGILKIALELQTRCWLPMDRARGNTIAVGDVFYAPIFHAGTGAKVIMFSININNLTAMEVLFTPHNKTTLDLAVYYPNGETAFLGRFLGDIALNTGVSIEKNYELADKIKTLVVASWDAINEGQVANG